VGKLLCRENGKQSDDSHGVSCPTKTLQEYKRRAMNVSPQPVR
jgi:hypothetical protein